MDLEYRKIPLQDNYDDKFNQNGYYLPFVISTLNNEFTTTIFEEHEAGLKPIELNDKTLIFSSSENNVEAGMAYTMNIFMALVFGLIIPLGSFFRGFLELESFIFTEGLALIFVLLAIWRYKKKKKIPKQDYCVLDRMHNEVSLPHSKRGKYFKVKFKDLKAMKWRVVGSVYAAGMPFSIYFVLKGIKSLATGFDLFNATLFEPRDSDAQESWSFYVWYMDKNRPLPPGKAFDNFRDQDFERRKAEGFPAPLYKSVIPTPEATPAQQLVREAFWKDIDHIVDAKEAYYNVESVSGAVKEFKRMMENKEN